MLIALGVVLSMPGGILSAAPVADEGPSTELVDQRIATLGSDGDADLIAAYGAVRTLLVEAQTYAADAERQIRTLDTAPAQLAEIQRELDSVDGIEEAETKLDGLAPEVLAERLAAASNEQRDIAARIEVLDRSIANDGAKETALRARLEAINARLAAAPVQSPIVIPSAAPSMVEALQWRDAATDRKLREERRAIQAALEAGPVLANLMSAQRAQQALLKARNAALVRELDRRVMESAPIRSEALQTGIDPQDPAFALAASLIERDEAVRAQVLDVKASLAEVRAAQEQLSARLRMLNERFVIARRLVDLAPDRNALGQVMMRYWLDVRDLGLIRPGVNVSEEIGSAVIRRIEHEESLNELTSALAWVNQRLRETGVDPDALSPATRDTLVGLTQSWRTALQSAVASGGEYIEALSALDAEVGNVRERTSTYRTYLESLLIWIPDHPSLWDMQRTDFVEEFQLLVATIKSVRLQLSAKTAFALFLALLLLQSRGRLRDLQVQANARILRPRDDAIGHTLRALLCVVLRALPVPLLLFALGAALDVEASLAAQVLHRVLAVVALMTFSLAFMWRLSEADGVARRHFGWSPVMMDRWHDELDYVLHRWLPVAVAAAIASGATPDEGTDVLFRLLTLGALLMISWRLGREIRVEVRETGAEWFAGTLNRFRVVVVALFLIMAVAVIWGQVFSVRVITASMANTIWVGVLLLVIHALLMRWLQVTRRRLRMTELLSQRTPIDDDKDGAGVVEQASDLTDISSETEQLVHGFSIAAAAVAAVMIWGPLLPAFEALSQVELWTSSSQIDGQTVVVQITLASVALVMLLAALTLFAAKRLPALVELSLRSRTSVSPGARYTVSTLLNYAIIGVGIVAGLSALGLRWESLQWLVAALGVGIGFGLQEIVANFISGLIILFERPIRVGDIVTVGDKDGTVTRIRIRATTIRDWDGRELLVPNKEFITGRLLNWTLSDSQTRVVINVGVAYGSNVEEALRVLHDAVLAHPRTLGEPAPLIIFENFGDNALELSARCFIDSVEGRLQTMSELRSAINEAYEAAGIVIAFPQRDVHLDASAPIRIALEPAEGRAASGTAAEENRSPDAGTASPEGPAPAPGRA